MIDAAPHRPEAYRRERLDAADALRRSHAFLELMRTRRSIRSFAPEPVPLELVLDAVRVAGSAPSGANQQPWRFEVVTDPGLKRRLRAAAEREERLLYERRAGPEYLRAIRPIGTDWSKPHITEAPCLVVAFEQPWREEDGDRHKHYYVRESVGIAVGFLLCALHNSGLGTLTHAPSPMGFLRELLGRPEHERPFLLIAVGYPAEEATVPSLPRKSLAEIANVDGRPAGERR